MTASSLLPLSLSSNARIKGTVIDEKGDALKYARVVAYSKDSIATETTTTGENGLFNLNNSDIAFLHVSSFGYRQKTVEVTSVDTVCNIRLQPQENALKEVVINGRQPDVKLRGNSLVIPISGTYLEKYANADELLGRLPTVSGYNGNFQVFGRGTPMIYINGRKMTSSTQLTQIEASNIKEVRIISNPGAKYDAEVRSVIEITTKKPFGEGLSISATTRERIANYFSSFQSITLNYRTGGLDIELSGMFWKDRMKFGTDAEKTIYLPSVVTDRLWQTVKNLQTNSLCMLRINYQISPQHMLGAYYRAFWNKTDISYRNRSEVVEDNDTVDVVRNLGQDISRSYPTHSANLYYNGKIGNIELNSDIDCYFSSPRSLKTNDERSEYSGNRFNSYGSFSSSRMWAYKLASSYSVRKSKIEVGIEYTDSKVDMATSSHDQYLPSGDNSIRESNLSVFGQYGLSLADGLDISAGIRYQHTDHKYTDNNTDTQYRRLDNVFPSASLSYRKEKVSASLSYSSAFNQPSYSRLDGNLMYVNRFLYKKGNPNLRNSKFSSMEIMVAYSPAFLRMSYVRQNDPILFFTEILDADKNICLSTYTNGPERKALDVIGGVTIRGKSWNLSPNLGIEKQWFKMRFRDAIMSFGKPRVSMNVNGSLTLPYGIWLMGDFSFQSKGNVRNLHLRSAGVLNLTLYKAFLKGNLSVWLAGRDLFDGQSSRQVIYSGDVRSASHEKMYMRSFEITVRYNFNVPRSKYKGRGAGESEKSRL